ncbi:MAG: nuclear transport factor 2 family protein [Bacteroidetes bacterium]|nr:MAG: nuclear transport factor 2 family protein [Bacteroidota bacterium]
MKITLHTNCGNSPKMELVKKLTVYFAAYDLDQIFDYLSDDISWTLVGEDTIQGKVLFKEELQKMSGNKATHLTIHSIVTHGKEGAVHGFMQMEDGHEYSFADFYEFTSAKGNKVKSIVSYVMQIG